MKEEEINRRIQAAEILGFTVERSYQKIGENFFIVFKVKKGDNILKTFTIEKDKTVLLSTYDQQLQILQARVDFLKEQKQKVNEVI